MAVFGWSSPHFFKYEDANGKTSWVEMTVFDFCWILLFAAMLISVPVICFEETRIKRIAEDYEKKWNDHDCMGEFNWYADDISAPPGTRAMVTYKMSADDKEFILRYEQLRHIGFETNYYAVVDGSNLGRAELTPQQVRALKTLERFRKK